MPSESALSSSRPETRGGLAGKVKSQNLQINGLLCPHTAAAAANIRESRSQLLLGTCAKFKARLGAGWPWPRTAPAPNVWLSKVSAAPTMPSPAPLTLQAYLTSLFRRLAKVSGRTIAWVGHCEFKQQEATQF